MLTLSQTSTSNLTMFKNLKTKAKTILKKLTKKPYKTPFQPSNSLQSLSLSTMHKSQPFIFPKTQSKVLPDPSTFFSSTLTPLPLPTNTFFQNFTLKNGDQPEYIHPYIIKSSNSQISISFPSLFSSPNFTYTPFVPDLTLQVSENSVSTHKILSFSDLGLTLEVSKKLKFYLVRGSPYITGVVTSLGNLVVSTIHAIIGFFPNEEKTKFLVKLNNGQSWILYFSSPVELDHEISLISLKGYSGVFRIANLQDSSFENVLDKFSSCYPVSGNAVFTKPFCVEYKYETKGSGDLLMLAHCLHVELLEKNCGKNVISNEFSYKSMDGELVGIVGDSWLLKSEPVSITWHSIRGVKEDSYSEIINALVKDVEGLSTIATNSSYFYGKLIARAARLALIAEEVCYLDVIPAIRSYLKDTIEPWLNGTFSENGFLHDPKWGGIVTKLGSLDPGADFGFGVYNDHHYHLGYFVYAIAVLAKIDPGWGRKYKPQAYSLMLDYMHLGGGGNSVYPRLRNFDLWKLHSWAGGLTEFADGRNQESTSEAVNAYYAAALMGLAYGDVRLVSIASTLSSLEIHSARTWWHIREEDCLYAEDFTKENRVVGVLWSTKRDSGLWFAPPEWKECRLGIQLLPILPISETLFSDKSFVKQLVEWTNPALNREGVGEGWKGFVYALEGIYDNESGLNKIRGLNGYDDGNSLTNLLWWIHSRGDEC